MCRPTYITDVSDDLAWHPKGAKSTADQVTHVTDDWTPY